MGPDSTVPHRRKIHIQTNIGQRSNTDSTPHRHAQRQMAHQQSPRLAPAVPSGKAKSLTKQCILWCPIAAIVEPQVQRFYLQTAARAFTLLLRLLVSEILGAFLVLKISDLQPWIHDLSDWQCTTIGEADCSGQFNNISPLSVMKDLQESIRWLAKRRHWNANNLVWSIHRDNQKLDRARMGTCSHFTHIRHTELENLVYFSLLTNTHTHTHTHTHKRPVVYGHAREPSLWEARSAPKVQI